MAITSIPFEWMAVTLSLIHILVVEYQDTKIDVSQGNIDLNETHKQIVDIMEGGKEAFDKRQLIYTSWK